MEDGYDPSLVEIEQASIMTFQWDITNYKMKKLKDNDGPYKYISLSGTSGVSIEGNSNKNETILDPVEITLTTRNANASLNITIGRNGSLEKYTENYEITSILKNLTTKKFIVFWKTEPGYGNKRQNRWKNQWKSGWTEEFKCFTNEEMKTFESFFNIGEFQLELCFRDLNPLLEDVASYNGVLDWIIDDYSQKRKLQAYEMYRPLYVKGFYTSKGYRMCARLCLNLYSRSIVGSQIGLSLAVCKGKYDSKLPRRFDHVRKVSIMPWDSLSKPLVMVTKVCPPETDEDDAEFVMGKFNMAFIKARSKVENGSYIRYDKLRVRIEIIPYADYVKSETNNLVFDEVSNDVGKLINRHVVKLHSD